jgi:uncharacterized hydrophobic protein (TIGR00341 family)
MKNRPSIASKQETNLFRKLKCSFQQTFKRQDKVYNQVRENAKGDFDFYVLIIFSAIIITLGILIDSSAVVIGGMLIAPFVWPILAISLGITMGRSGLIRKAILTILLASFLVVAISALLSFILPEIVSTNNQLFSRTTPTLLELLIGLTAGFIGAFIIAYPNIGSAIAGVVVAAAIVPPLATIGISASKMDWSSAGGAILLFLSQLVAIVFSASILFILSNFRYRNNQAEKKTQAGFSWTILLLIIIVIPLYFSTSLSATQVKYQKIINAVISDNFDNARVLEMDFVNSKDKTSIQIVINNDEELTQDNFLSIQSILEKRLKKKVVLDINIIPNIGFQKQSILGDNDLRDVISTITQQTISDKDKENIDKYLKCRIFLNNEKTEKYFSIEEGCPICPKFVVCQDSSEYPQQLYNESKGECQDIEFINQAPCFPQYNTSQPQTELIEN